MHKFDQLKWRTKYVHGEAYSSSPVQESVFHSSSPFPGALLALIPPEGCQPVDITSVRVLVTENIRIIAVKKSG